MVSVSNRRRIESKDAKQSVESGDHSTKKSEDVAAKSLGHCIIHKLKNVGADFPMFIDGATGREWTGAQLAEKVLNVACALIDLHRFQAGDVICIRFENSIENVILALATIVAGGTISSSNPREPYDAFFYMSERVEPKILFCCANEVDWAKRLQADLGVQAEAIVMGCKAVDCAKAKMSHFDDLLSYDSSKSKSLKSLPFVPKDPSSAPAFITMSSGTTGAPKAVPVSYENCLADITTCASGGWTTFSRTVSCTSFEHISGRLINFGPLTSESLTTVVLPSFTAETYLETIAKYKLDILYLGTASLNSIITHPKVDQYDLSSLRVISPVGTRVTFLDTIRDFLDKHPHITHVGATYGPSEVSLVCVKQSPVERFFEDPHNCGKVVSHMEAKIVDTTTGERATSANVRGMLHVRGPTMFQGYYDVRRVRARSTTTTEERSVCDDSKSPFIRESSTFDSEGYYITGDIAYFNENDELYIVGREKETLRCRKGKKVLPHELEDLIEKHPAVSAACVLGVDNPREVTHHCPRAFVVVKSSCYDEDCELKLANDKKTNEQVAADHDDEILVHKGSGHKLCSLSTGRRRAIAENLMRFFTARTNWEKHLTGGIVILDRIPSLRSGKMDKQYLRSLSLDQVEIYGDRSC